MPKTREPRLKRRISAHRPSSQQDSTRRTHASLWKLTFFVLGWILYTAVCWIVTVVLFSLVKLPAPIVTLHWLFIVLLPAVRRVSARKFLPVANSLLKAILRLSKQDLG